MSTLTPISMARNCWTLLDQLVFFEDNTPTLEISILTLLSKIQFHSTHWSAHFFLLDDLLCWLPFILKKRSLILLRTLSPEKSCCYDGMLHENMSNREKYPLLLTLLLFIDVCLFEIRAFAFLKHYFPQKGNLHTSSLFEIICCIGMFEITFNMDFLQTKNIFRLLNCIGLLKFLFYCQIVENYTNIRSILFTF